MPPKDRDPFAKICKLAGRAVERYHMIRPGDKIAVGLSWGKDSVMLMHVLTRLLSRSPVKFELAAVWVDAGFHEGEQEQMAEYAARQGWAYHVERIGMDRILREKGAADKPCSLCSRLRRGKLHAAMDRLGFGTLALGQHRDDLVASLLMSLFRGGGVRTMGPNVPADGGRKRLIRPLCLVPEELIVETADRMRLPVLKKCLYIEDVDDEGDRQFVRDLVRDLDSRFPGVSHAILTSMADVRVEHLLDTRYLRGRGAQVGGRHEAKPPA